MKNNYRIAWLGLCLWIAAYGAAAAAPASVDGTVTVNIKAQPVGSALNELARQSGMQVFFYSDVAKGAESPAVAGAVTPDMALKRLLSNTNLSYAYVNPRTVVVAPGQAGVAEHETAHEKLRLASLSDGEAATEDDNRPTRVAAATSVPTSNDERGRSRASKGRMEEVIVTAQKRQERLIDTPISVGVLTGDKLDRTSTRAVTDVLNQLGGVTVTEIQPGRTDIVVRGVVSGGGIVDEGGTSTTAYYLDEVPFGFTRFSQVGDSNAFDLARIEVLRGPQGTLYGANSLSGAVRVLTNDADLNTFQIKGRTLVSNTDSAGVNYSGDFAINAALVPGELAIRAVASYSDLSGFVDSTFDGKNEINDSRAQNYRLKMYWKPNEALGIKLGYSRSEIDNGAPSLALDNLTTPFSSDQPDKRVMNIYSLIAEYKWRSISLLSSTGFIDYSADTIREILLSATTRLPFLNQDRMKSSLSQEFRLSSDLGGPWQWSAGAFYKDTKQTRTQVAQPTFPGVFIAGSESESYAVFGETTRSFQNGKLALTAGLRYSDDRETLQDLGSFQNLPLQPDATDNFDHTTGRLVLTYRPDGDAMFYTSVATGFRSGLQQSPAILAIAPGFPSVDPDSLISYELGSKGSLFNGHVSYETALYYMDWADIQQSLVLPIGFTARVNAGDASGLGADATISFQPTNEFTTQLSVGWNDLSFDKNVFNFDRATQSNLLLFPKGSRLNNSPEWTGSIGATYRIPTPRPGVDFLMSSNFAYGSIRTLRFLTASTIRETRSEEMHLLKASVGLTGDQWSLNLYADNLLNSDAAITPPDSNAALTSVRLRPRTIGLQLTFDY